ncbi:MAG: DEAD/DEAH box helicase [Victivallaceae bacterium]|nr:DEAD/DEAH box helicase [Victivallaceae bacterium]
MTFEKFGLLPEILTGVKNKGYNEPTPIQTQAIPVIMQGRDILAGAQTGTGKTAAFTLPLLHLLSTNKVANDHRPRALVLTPTRELAAQVGASIQTYGQDLDIKSTAIFGGVGITPQIERLQQGVDIVIGTPGRLIDLMEQEELDLSQLEVLILDEADRMLDMGFIHDIRKIIKMVPKKRQTLFFSATYSNAIKKLADTILYKPEMVEVSRANSAAELVKQCAYYVPRTRKRELLSHLIKTGNWIQVLVFTRTKQAASELAQQLVDDDILATAIHGDKSQAKRTRALADFKAGKFHVLVATDIAARGLDIVQLPHVVNYELPNITEDYIHRIGRTGRAGRPGSAVALVSPGEIKQMKAIEKLLKKSIYVKRNDDFATPSKNRDRGRSGKGAQTTRRRKDKNRSVWGNAGNRKKGLTRAQRLKI